MYATGHADATPDDVSVDRVPAELALKNAGFWIRFTATLIDVAILYVGVSAVVCLAALTGIYVPFEMTMVLAGVCYSLLLLRWKGKTIGKALCGVTVRTRTDDPVRILRAIARETLGKLVSTAGLFLGFLWVAIPPRKRTWHDRIVGTMAVQDVHVIRRARVALAMVCVVLMLGAGLYVYELVEGYRLVRSMSPPGGAAAAYTLRAPSALMDVHRIGRNEQINIADWIDRNSRTPLEYAVAKVSEHQVVIFGEVHERREGLRLLNEMIPVLHQRAGVHCVAMEVCLAEDNPLIERLVTADAFDRNLAMTIARHQPFGLWGWKDYWDVFETVWLLNQAIPEAEEKFRVIGLDRRMDMPSVAMLGLEDNAARDCPPWEKLRVFRALRTIPRVLVRDAFMAAQVEKEIIERGQRGIVWVGRNHSAIGCPGAGAPDKLPRMGFLLHQRHGDRVFQIRLHGMDFSAALLDRTYEGTDPRMAEVLESIMRLSDNQPVGFDVAPSPLAMLRDEGSIEFHFDARLGFVDVAAGYVFLAPWRELKTCDWLEGYISPEMFVANKPFYQAFGRRGGKEIRNARDANALFADSAD